MGQMFVLCLLHCVDSTGVNGFTLDPTLGEFVLTHPNVKIPKRGRTYSFNEANQYKWPAALRRYVSDVKQALGEQKLSYTSRYVGSLVGDLHRTLIYGGSYCCTLSLKFVASFEFLDMISFCLVLIFSLMYFCIVSYFPCHDYTT